MDAKFTVRSSKYCKCIPKKTTMGLPRFKIHYWPGLTTGLLIFTLLLSYIISVSNGHVYSFFPYISDSGAIPPESCIFGQLLNIQAVTLAITLYIRYRQVDCDIESGAINVPKIWNTISSWCIAVICVGISMVGNFQETSIIVIHFMGAGSAFSLGTVYLILQTRISFASRNSSSDNRISKQMLYFRVILIIAIVALLLITGICGSISLLMFTGKTLIWWTKEDGGFQIKLVASFSEWLMVLFIYIYITTYTKEFKSITFEEIVFKRRGNHSKSKRQEII